MTVLLNPELPVAGQVDRVVSADLEVRGLRLSVGDTVTIDSPNGPVPAEVISVHPNGANIAPLADPTGMARGLLVRPTNTSSQPYGLGVLGRVVDAMGRPADGRGPIRATTMPMIGTVAPPAMERRRITEPLPVGVKVLDTFLTAARGQRLGIFAGSGVGKSTLLGMMARGTAAKVCVICLVGERGREVREFVEDDLGPEGLARSVVVVATSDQPALTRVRAMLYATWLAERFADQGNDVLLMVDSLTRLALAQREIGLAAGEPPTARGFTPSVFALMPKLLERAGPRANGTVTGFYTVLVDGDDHNDPIADTARGILDGHIVLDRRLAHAGRYPAVDVLASISRLASRVVSPTDAATVQAARAALAAAESVKDLVEVGAYQPGSNPAADVGLALAPAIIEFCKQPTGHRSDFTGSFTELAAIMAQVPR